MNPDPDDAVRTMSTRFPREDVLWAVRAPRATAIVGALAAVPLGIGLALACGDSWLLRRLGLLASSSASAPSPDLMHLGITVFGLVVALAALHAAWVAHRTCYLITRRFAAVVVGGRTVSGQSWYADGACGYEARMDLSGRGDLVLWREWIRESKGRRRRVEQGFHGLHDAPAAERALRVMLGEEKLAAAAAPVADAPALGTVLPATMSALLARVVADERILWSAAAGDITRPDAGHSPAVVVSDHRLLLFRHGGWPIRSFDPKALLRLECRAAPATPTLQLAFERSDFDEGPPGVVVAAVADVDGFDRALNRLRIAWRGP